MESNGQTNQPRLSDCWAKTHPQTGHPALTVRDHCRVVGAVADLVLRNLAPACSEIPPLGAAALIAAHDIGKITPGFQAKCPHFAYIPPRVYSCASNHAEVSQGYLASLPAMQDERGFPWNWTLAADGHHGHYNLTSARKTLGMRRGGLSEGGCGWADQLRHELMQALIREFGPLPCGPVETSSRLHWLTGCTTFCDWIGSNTAWFPLLESAPLRDQYTAETCQANAQKALAKIGWHRRAVRPNLNFGHLFAEAGKPAFAPRALQQALVDMADRPGLYLVEASMGMGKTEAALAAAYRRWTEGGERGLYFALPTQLTSNRIHERIRQFLENTAADEDVRQTLAHANAWLREDRIQTFNPAPTTDADDAREAHQWFASTRKALLAPFGTGTIDQALMARIAVKHSALRLFALSGKVVVMDEVHSYDPYTSRLIDHLIPWLLECGCTVFVLSATLSERRRRELIAAAGATAPEKLPSAYPLLTAALPKETARFQPVDKADSPPVQVALEHIAIETHANAPLARIASAAEAGACVVIIRNTVASAQETYRLIKEALKDDAIPVGLLHSRFPQFVRDENEDRWMRRLGKDEAERPRGCVLVATQVVEQSVDIDADLLVTDLAPTDLLLQRIGRLHRHPRSRPSGFEEPLCLILHPKVDWKASARDIVEALGPSAFVYPPVSLYQASTTWEKRTSVTLPDNIRSLLEESDLANLPKDLPEGLTALREKMDTELREQLSSANRLDPFAQISTEDTEGARTRWIRQASTLLVLLREPPLRQGNTLRVRTLDGSDHSVPAGVFHYPLAVSLHKSAVRIPRFWTKGIEPPDWLTLHVHGAVCAVVSTDSTTLRLIGAPEGGPTLHYHPQTGIHYERPSAPPTFTEFAWEEENDSWF